MLGTRKKDSVYRPAHRKCSVSVTAMLFYQLALFYFMLLLPIIMGVNVIGKFKKC